jgi:hypothetical protein
LNPKELYEAKMRTLEQMETLKGCDPSLATQLQEYETHRKSKEVAAMVAQALQQAITETVQRIASVIINERREEIEAACNFGDLRDAIAAELARQFMAARFLGQPTPFDPPGNGGAVGLFSKGIPVKTP